MAKKTHFLFFLTLLLCLHTGFAMTLELKKSFDISLDGSLQSWTLTLVPRDQVLQGMLRQVNISGRQHINYLVFKTATEDRTEILLKDQYSPKQFPQELLQ